MEAFLATLIGTIAGLLFGGMIGYVRGSRDKDKAYKQFQGNYGLIKKREK